MTNRVLIEEKEGPAYKVAMVSPGELVVPEYNAQVRDQETQENIAKSISEFGFVLPIIVNRARGRENVIVGGVGRRNAALSLGHKYVPVYFIEEPDIEREKELNFLLNNIRGETSEEILVRFYSTAKLEKKWGWKPTKNKRTFKKKNVNTLARDRKLTFTFSPDLFEQVKEKLKKWDKSKEEVLIELLHIKIKTDEQSEV